jgi:hypothetical protein
LNKVAAEPRKGPSREALTGNGPPAGDLVDQATVLEIDTFPAMWHVTLRWDPAHSLLRQKVEGELGRDLAETPVPSHDLGLWLTLGAVALLVLTCGTVFALIVWYYLRSS